MNELLKKANEAMTNEDYESAKVLLDKAILLDSQLIEAYHLRTRVFLFLHENENGLNDAIKFQTLDPQNYLPYYWMAAHLDRLNRRTEACEAYLDVLKLEPNHLESLLMAASILLDKSQPDQALVHLSRAISLQPKEARTFRIRAKCHSQLKDYVSALADLNELLKIIPTGYNALASRGDCLVSLEKYHEAMADYDLAIKLCPESATLLRKRGKLHKKMGNSDLAAQDFNKADELDGGEQEGQRSILDFFD